MRRQTLIGRRVGLSVVILAVVGLTVGLGSRLVAQSAPDQTAGSDASAPKVKKRHAPRKVPAESGAAGQNKAPDAIDFAAQLGKAGVASCRSQVNALAGATMGSVVQYNTVSSWANVSGGQRAVSVAIGQRYANGSAVPFSVAQIVSTPDQRGGCDGFSVQVFPSPLSCDKLRETLGARGKQIGDLAGIALMQDAAGRTMLVPTAANTCVLVATRTDYAN